MPQHQRARSRPEKWTELVVYCCTYLGNDHIEQLLDFRREYRRIKKRYGVKAAKSHARKQAALWAFVSLKEFVIASALIGKKLFSTE